MKYVWIDRHGGRSYHKKNCVMVKDPKFHYEKVDYADIKSGKISGPSIAEDWEPCSCIVLDRRYKPWKK